MLSEYDAVVIGAGPAGSKAAFEIASAGYSVLLLEKHEKPGVPLCCAEGATKPSLEKVIDLEPGWISSKIEYALLVGPGGFDIEVHHPDAGYILDRKTIDNDLAQMAVRAGCDLQCNAIGLNLNGGEELFDSVNILRSDGGIVSVKARIFIAADGVESKIARLAGIDNLIELDDIESILQYRIENIDIDPARVEFHVGNDIAPNGYLWVFPKSSHSANVGIGVTVSGGRSEICRKLLDNFVKKNFESARVVEEMCGQTPKYQGPKKLLLKNLLVVGDAGRVLDSLTGAGIVNALLSGKFAGVAAARYLNGDIEDIKEINRLYPNRFLKVKGEELRNYARLRRVYEKMTDKDFRVIIESLRRQFPDRKTTGVNVPKLLIRIIKTRPQLLRLVRYLI